MSKKSSQDASALVAELDQLVHMLGDGPEFQHEIPLPADESPQQSLTGLDRPETGKPPVLTSIHDSQTSAESAQLDALIEELIEEMMPRFEILLRARLKARLTASKKSS